MSHNQWVGSEQQEKIINRLLQELNKGDKSLLLYAGQMINKPVNGSIADEARAHLTSEADALVQSSIPNQSQLSGLVARQKHNINSSVYGNILSNIGNITSAGVQRRRSTADQAYDIETERIRSVAPGALIGDIRGIHSAGIEAGSVGRRNVSGIGSVVNEMIGTVGKYANEMATASIEEKMLRSHGLASDQMMDRGHKIGANVYNRIREHGISSSVENSLKSGSNSVRDYEQAATNAIMKMQELAKHMSELSSATSKATDAEKEKAELDHRRAVEEAQDAKDALNAAYRHGRDATGNGMSTFGGYMQNASAFIGTVASAESIMVSQRAARAAHFNRMYGAASATLDGDMLSGLMLTGGTWGKNAQVAAGGQTMLTGASQIAGILGNMAVEGAAMGADVGTLHLGDAVSRGGKLVAQSGSDLYLLGTGIKQEAARMQMLQALEGLSAEDKKLTAMRMQGHHDMFRGVSGIAAAMGGNVGATANESLTSTAATNEAYIHNVGYEKTRQGLTVLGQGLGVGSGFNDLQGAKILTWKAQELERQGMGTFTQNLSRFTTLGQSGSNNPAQSLENIMAAAVAKGFDSSKSVDDLVNYTSSMAKNTLAGQLGVDVTAGLASSITNMADSDIENKTAALTRALTIQQDSKARLQGDDLSVEQLVLNSRIQKGAGFTGPNGQLFANNYRKQLSEMPALTQEMEEALRQDPTGERGIFAKVQDKASKLGLGDVSMKQARQMIEYYQSNKLAGDVTQSNLGYQVAQGMGGGKHLVNAVGVAANTDYTAIGRQFEYNKVSPDRLNAMKRGNEQGLAQQNYIFGLSDTKSAQQALALGKTFGFDLQNLGQTYTNMGTVASGVISDPAMEKKKKEAMDDANKNPTAVNFEAAGTKILTASENFSQATKTLVDFLDKQVYKPTSGIIFGDTAQMNKGDPDGAKSKDNPKGYP